VVIAEDKPTRGDVECRVRCHRSEQDHSWLLVGVLQLCWETIWGLYSVVRLQPPLEIRGSSPLEVKEPGSELDIGMMEQAHAMIQRFPEEKC
jgi:hypothetical protein